jgi:hypothetical protein
LRFGRAGDVLNIVAVDRNKAAHALWPQRRDDAGGAAGPVIAGEHGTLRGKDIEQFAQVLAERGLLSRTRRLGGAKARRPKAAQVRHDHASPGRA